SSEERELVQRVLSKRKPSRKTTATRCPREFNPWRDAQHLLCQLLGGQHHQHPHFTQHPLQESLRRWGTGSKVNICATSSLCTENNPGHSTLPGQLGPRRPASSRSRHVVFSPGKKCCIPLLSSFFSRWGHIPCTSLIGTRFWLMSLWTISGLASHWGRTI
uniref:Uncharacterized protein n=1 Tax=Paramormyrops kingsleyae TaxID=1676925 RepID=A0A3B3QFE7_9TELE